MSSTVFSCLFMSSIANRENCLKSDKRIPNDIWKAVMDSRNWYVEGNRIFLKPSLSSFKAEDSCLELKKIIDDWFKPNGIELNGRVTIEDCDSRSNDIDLMVVANRAYEQPMLMMF